ncbi:Ig-like domain (group 2) [Lachnospiraceae bacterium KHCPX20]|nr:Ig-like domain (group 2) [Lachnospiraceae bacterium KHCPX20]
MANFKKGIALALAATTALTFAPVSTLGIPSVVEAEAAGISSITNVKFTADSDANATFLGGVAGVELADLNAASTGAAIATTDKPVLYVKKGESAVLAMTTEAAATAGAKLDVLKAPAGIKVTMNDLTAGSQNFILKISATDAVKCDLNGTPNVWVDIDGVILKFYVASDSFTQSISGGDSFDINEGATKSIANILGSDGAKVYGTSLIGAMGANTSFGDAAGTYAVDESLIDAADFKTGDGATIKSLSNRTTTTDKITAKVGKAGSTGTITLTNKAKEIDTSKAEYGSRNLGKIAVEKATKTIKVNVKDTVAAATATDLTVGTDGEDVKVPFKALVSISGDVKATEVDADGNALSTATGLVKIDNDAQTVTFVGSKSANDDQTATIKFVPKDTTKNGNGVTLAIKQDADKNSFDRGAGTASLDMTYATVNRPATCEYVADLAGLNTAWVNADDAASFYFENDAIGKVIAVTKEDPSNKNVFTLTARLGTPSGTYAAYATTSDKSEGGLLNITKVNVVVNGTAGDDPDYIGVAKINGKDVITSADYIVNSNNYANLSDAEKAAVDSFKRPTVLSGATTLTLTSPAAEIGLVKDVQLTDVYLLQNDTGARITSGFTVDGMNITINDGTLIPGKSYTLYAATKGTGLAESKSMTVTDRNTINFTVKQGYSFNYNLGGATVKTGKTLDPVAISSDENDAPVLEDGSKLEYTGATFLGWAYTDGATKADISAFDAKNGLSATQVKTALDKQVNNTINLYAVWDYTSYKLTVDANGGAGSTYADKNFNVASTDVTLPTDLAKDGKPVIGFTTTLTGKTTAGAKLPLYKGTLNSAQLQAIVKEVDETAKTTSIKLYAQYGAALKTVAITPATLSLKVGKAAGQLTTALTDENGAAVTNAEITYTSDNPGVATVDANGVVTPVAAGIANVTATAKYAGVAVTSNVSVVTVAAADPTPVVVQKPAKVTGVKIVNVKGAKVKVSFKKAARAKGYKVVYTVGKKTVTKTTTKTSITLKVKKGAKVTVKVRAYNHKADKSVQYGTYSAKKSLKTDKK